MFTLGLLTLSLNVFGAPQDVRAVGAISVVSKSGEPLYTLTEETPIVAESCSEEFCEVKFTIEGKSYVAKKFPRLSLVKHVSSGPTTRPTRAAARAAVNSPNTIQNSIQFASPTCGCTYGSCRISSSFNPHRRHPISNQVRPHRGTDIAGGAGTPIVAAESGTITSAGWRSGYGKTIIIDHGSSFTTLYAHMDSYERTSGWVQKGEIIGYVGSTGDVTGPHLHFEVRRNGVHVDPEQYLGSNGSTYSQSCSTVRSAGEAEEAAEQGVVI